MIKRVELPNGEVADFPVDMDDDAIASVLAKEFPAPKKVDPLANSVMRDVPSAKRTSPVRPDYEASVKAAYDNASPVQRKAMAADRNSVQGRIAAELGTAYDRLDVRPSSLADQAFNRLERVSANGIEMPRLSGATKPGDGRKESTQPLTKPKELHRTRTGAELAKDTALDLGIGVTNIVGAVPNLVSPDGQLARATRDAADSLRGMQSDTIQAQAELANQRINEAGQEGGLDGLSSQFGQALDEYGDNPALAIRLVVQNIPSILPGIGAAKLAQLAPKVLPSLKMLASSGVPLTAAAITNAVLNAGGARGEAYEDLLQTQLDQNVPKSVAEDRAKSGSILPAAIGGVTGFVSGRSGLESALLSKGTSAPIKKGLSELASEQAEEVLPKLATNYEASKYDDRSMLKDVGRTIAETHITSGPMAAATTVVDAWKPSSAEGQIAELINRTDLAPVSPQMVAARAAMESRLSRDPALMDPAPPRQPEGQPADEVREPIAQEPGLSEPVSDMVSDTQGAAAPVADQSVPEPLPEPVAEAQPAMVLDPTGSPASEQMADPQQPQEGGQADPKTDSARGAFEDPVELPSDEDLLAQFQAEPRPQETEQNLELPDLPDPGPAAQPGPVAEPAPIESDAPDLSLLSDEDLAMMVKNAPNSKVREQISAERRKRRAKMLADQSSMFDSHSEKPVSVPAADDRASLPLNDSADLIGQTVKFTRKGEVTEGKVQKVEGDFVTLQVGDETLTVTQKRIVKDPEDKSDARGIGEASKPTRTDTEPVKAGDDTARPSDTSNDNLTDSALLANKKQIIQPDSDYESSRVLQGPAVIELKGDEAPDKGFQVLRRWASDLFQNVFGGKAINKRLGEVDLNERSVRDSMGHGMSRQKASAFAAVKDVIEKGSLIASNRGGDVDSYFISAPAKIGGKDDVVTVLVKRDAKTQRMYLHSVATKESLLKSQESGADDSTDSPERSGKLTSADIRKVLNHLLNVKDLVRNTGEAIGEMSGASKPVTTQIGSSDSGSAGSDTLGYNAANESPSQQSEGDASERATDRGKSNPAPEAAALDLRNVHDPKPAGDGAGRTGKAAPAARVQEEGNSGQQVGSVSQPALIEREGDYLQSLAEINQFSQAPNSSIAGAKFEPAEPEQIKSFAPLARAIKSVFGKDVVLYKSPKRKDGDFVNDFRGLFVGNRADKVYVGSEEPKSLNFVTFHELDHAMEAADPDLHLMWRRGLQSVSDVAGYVRSQAERFSQDENGQTDQQKVDAYMADRKWVNDTKKEFSANFAGAMWSDPRFVRSLAKDNPGKFGDIAKTVIGFIDGLLARFKSLLASGQIPADSRVTQFIKDLDAAKALYKEYLDEYQGGLDRQADSIMASLRQSAPSGRLGDSSESDDQAAMVTAQSMMRYPRTTPADSIIESLRPTSKTLPGSGVSVVNKIEGSKSDPESPGIRFSRRQPEVSSPEFKRWFGDWETLQKSQILNGSPFAELSTNDVPNGPISSIVSWAAGIFAEQGGVAVRPELGEVLIDERAAKSSLAHGKPNKFKSAAFPVVKDVIERGVLVLRNDSPLKTSFYYSAPVKIDDKDDVVTVLIRRDANAQRMYLHSVATREYLLTHRVSSADAFEASERSGSSESGDVARILQSILKFKAPVSKVVDPEGRPLVVYHGTKSNFEVFDRQYQSTGKLGKGFYFSPSTKTANLFAKIGGLSGTDSAPKVLPVYLSIKNPARFDLESMPSEKIDQGKLIEQGFDGTILYKGGQIQEIAAFQPEQIKSAIGNNGQFDSGNPDIRFSSRKKEAPQQSDSQEEGPQLMRVSEADGAMPSETLSSTSTEGDTSLLREPKNNDQSVSPKEYDPFNGKDTRGENDEQIRGRDGVRAGQGPSGSGNDGAGKGADSVLLRATHALLSYSSLSGRAIGKALAEQQRANLVGQRVADPESLADLARIYRDPRFETFRLVFLDTDNKVVSQIGLTNRMPSSAAVIIGRDMEAYVEKVVDAAKTKGAVSYYMLHNHPTGDPSPSEADRKATAEYAVITDALGIKFNGHVVIDTTKYGFINRIGKTRVEDLQTPNKAWDRPAFKFAGVAIRGPSDLMNMQKDLSKSDAVVFVTTDAKLVVQGVSEMPLSDLNRLNKGMVRRAVLRAVLGNSSARILAYAPDAASAEKIADHVEDVIYKDGSTLVSFMTETGRGSTVLKQARKTRVSKDTTPEFDSITSKDERGGAHAAQSVGEFDPADPGILMNRRNPVKAAIKGVASKVLPNIDTRKETAGLNFTLPAFKHKDAALRYAQDYFLRVKQVQLSIADQGGKLTEENDAYLAEERYYGRAGERIEKFHKESLEPLVKQMVADGVALDEVALFAYAQHAKERNAKHSAPGVIGSGMTNAEADAILDLAKRQGTFDKLEAATAGFRNIVTQTRKVLLDEGLITPELHAKLTNSFQNYVPLRGFWSYNDAGNPVPQPKGNGFSIKGSETIEAMGRTTMATKILENIVGDHERAIIRGEKNRVAKRMLKFVIDNPDGALWSAAVSESPADVVTDEGEVIASLYADQKDPMYPQSVGVKVKGREIRLTIKDEALLRAFMKMDIDPLNKVLQVTSKINQTLGALYTSLSPEFVLTNGVRDILTGALQAPAYGLTAQEILKHYPGAMKHGYRNNRDKDHDSEAQKEWAKWIQRFNNAGGQTSFLGLKTLEDQSAILHKLYSENQNPQGVVDRSVRAARAGLELIEDVNNAVENAMRVAAFRAAVEKGMSNGRAASIAKNLTVNFNRKGEGGAVINALWLFANASIQGSAAFLRAAYLSKTVRYSTAALGAGLFGLAMTNILVGGEDEDGIPLWDKVSPDVKASNIVVMLPSLIDMEGVERVGTRGQYIKFPLPHALFPVSAMSNGMVDAFRYIKSDGKFGRSLGEVSWHVTKSIGANYVPVSLLPTLPQLVVNAQNEKGRFGNDLAPPPGYSVQSNSSRAFHKDQNTVWQEIAVGLNSVTGGTPAKSGMVDMAPGVYRDLFFTLGGGPAKFMSDVATAVQYSVFGTDNLRDAATETSNRIPFARRFYAQTGTAENAKLYYDIRKSVMEAKAGIHSEVESLSGEKYGDFKKERPAQFKRMAEQGAQKYGEIRGVKDVSTKTVEAYDNMFKGLDKKLKQLKEEEIAVQRSDWPVQKKRRELELINNRRHKVYVSATKAWMEERPLKSAAR